MSGWMQLLYVVIILSGFVGATVFLIYLEARYGERFFQWHERIKNKYKGGDNDS